MAAPSYTPLVPGAVENVNTLNTILAALAAACTTGAVIDAQLASPNNVVYKTLATATSLVTGSSQSNPVVAGTYILGPNVFIGNGVAMSFPILPIYLLGTDLAVAGLTTKVRVRATIASNATAAGVNFTVGLNPFTIAGAAGPAATVGAGTGASTTFTTPSASTVTTSVSADITIPADGAYCLIVSPSGTPAANFASVLQAQLQVRNV